ncbi:radical SAM protein, partial [Desulfovibrio sp. OttesenSCG-928-A18]|nr:radical SAM protein [Desulfovibrio sp. OttesenSCG-928-A18]
MTVGPRFFLCTLGCKVNQYESHALREAWTALGGIESREAAVADLILVNSCAVTARAVADVRSQVRRLHRAAPHARILLTGCAAQVLGPELAQLPGVAAVFGQQGKAALLRQLPCPYPDGADAAGCMSPEAGAAGVSPPSGDQGSGAEAPFDSIYPPYSLSGYDRSRAVLKIQDGCSHGCSYCIVPQARGRARSRPVPEVLAEAGRLLRAGFREIVISGVNLRQYRADSASGGGDFWDLLAQLDSALLRELRLMRPEAGAAGAGLRLRISSLEPGQLGQKALDCLRACRLVAPHLHLSLQSGSKSVLERMGRGHYHPDQCTDFLRELREIWPVHALGADILTGFPGETEEEFEQGLACIRALPLTYAHVFPYSRRPGTRAASMPGQLPEELKKQRAAVIRALVREKKQVFLHSLLTQAPQYVVFEKDDSPLDPDKALAGGGSHQPSPGGYSGGMGHEAPCGDCKGAESLCPPLAPGPRDSRAGAKPEQGINEFYVECRLYSPPGTAPQESAAGFAPKGGGLTAVRALAVHGDCLLVVPCKDFPVYDSGREAKRPDRLLPEAGGAPGAKPAVSFVPEAPLLFPKKRRGRKGKLLPPPERSARLYVYIEASRVH